MTRPLSVLDLSPVGSGSTGAQALNNTLDLARHAERLGYHRYWLAEHHNLPSVASSAPEIMIGQVARETSTIRVGSGGIMLPNHSPLKVAEWFRVLEGLFPGRIDLGIGRAPGTDQITALALRRSRDAIAVDDFPQQLAEMLAYNTDSFPDGHPFKTISAVPVDVSLPPIFLLGSSDYSAHYAAAVGFGFAFAHHINPRDAVAVMRAYREQFTASEYLSAPWAILGVSVICAETEERAAALGRSVDLSFLRLQSGKRAPLPSPEEAAAHEFTPAEQAQALANRDRFIVGSPATVKARIEQLAEQCAADEVMITTNIHDHAERVRSYELLAETFGLEPVAGAAS
ncbi:MAG TPA: LLM class flavin-dependent oxidoreductase [Thermomicrobiales bacterium]|nr:LLM class flavin-dependent oxidoreductase [Thermomicrobiales bacterium]